MTCGAIKCLTVLRRGHEGFNDHVDWFRCYAPFPSDVDFSKYDIVDNEQGIQLNKGSIETFVYGKTTLG